LLLGKVTARAAAQPFLAEVRGAKAQAVAEGKAEAKVEAKEKRSEMSPQNLCRRYLPI